MWKTHHTSRITIGGFLMDWFSIQGIRDEVRKINWPKRKELSRNTIIVLSFIVFFAAYFMLTEVIISWFLRLIKVF